MPRSHRARASTGWSDRQTLRQTRSQGYSTPRAPRYARPPNRRSQPKRGGGRRIEMAIPTLPTREEVMERIEGWCETDERQQVTSTVDQDNLTLCAGDARKRWNASSTTSMAARGYRTDSTSAATPNANPASSRTSSNLISTTTLATAVTISRRPTTRKSAKPPFVASSGVPVPRQGCSTGDREFRPRPNPVSSVPAPRSSGAMAKARSSERRPLDRRWVWFATPVAREEVRVPSVLEKQ